jgi:small-conductance mechanosensitive channel
MGAAACAAAFFHTGFDGALEFAPGHRRQGVEADVRARSVLRTGPLNFSGIKLIGLNDTTLTRLGLSVAVIGGLLLVRVLVVLAVRVARRSRENDRPLFWTRQVSSLILLALAVAALVSIWFDDVSRATTVAGLAAAGLAVAAQRAVTAFAGYLVIMRGNTFTVGDRIRMGGVRGDVISLGFLQTRILEMGQPPGVNEQEQPGMWVRARQFSGRVVTVTNDKVFDEPIFNFTRELPYIWEEFTVPISYQTDRANVEQILLSAVSGAAGSIAAQSEGARQHFERRYGIALDHPGPKVYWRLTDNWVELTVRFIVPEHGIREIKDAITREVLRVFDDQKIQVASTTIEVTGVPTLRIARASDRGE